MRSHRTRARIVTALAALGAPFLVPGTAHAWTCNDETSKFVEDWKGGVQNSSPAGYGVFVTFIPPTRSLTSCQIVAVTAHERFDSQNMAETGVYWDSTRTNHFAIFFEYMWNGVTHGPFVSGTYNTNQQIWLMTRVDTRGQNTWLSSYSFDGIQPYTPYYTCTCNGNVGLAESEISRHENPSIVSDVWGLHQLDYLDYHWYDWTGVHCDTSSFHPDPTDYDVTAVTATEWTVQHAAEVGNC